MDARFLARIRAVNDPSLDQILADHRQLHSELDALQGAVWLSEQQQRRLSQLKRAKLSNKDKLMRMLAAREAQES